MAMKNQGSIVVDQPIDRVFEYTTNHVADWSLTVVEDEPLDTKPDGGVGSTFRCVTEDHGRRMEFQGEVTRHEPPRFSAVSLVGKQFNIEVLYTFEEENGSTRVTQASVVKPNGIVMKVLFAIIGPFAKKASCEATAKELASLKEKLELDRSSVS